MTKMDNKNTNYGNWVPAAMMKACGVAIVVLALLAVVCVLFQFKIPAVILGVLLIVVTVFTLYMKKCRDIFDFNKGGMMGKVHQYLVDHMKWDGDGTLLDIGCGAGALTIRCAKAYPNANLIGMDYWGAEWSYAKEQCENNAKAEGVADRIKFRKGDAGNMEFASESFEAAVSNFVFHEVRSQSDKRQVVREALRVVKKGGSFAFQDMFEQKALYGDMNAFIEELKAEGIAEIHYIGNVEKEEFIPKFVTAPWMIKGVGMIYGKK